MVHSRRMESDYWPRYVNASKLCRLCAVQNEHLIPILKGYGLEQEFQVKLRNYLSIEITEDDILPRQICNRCAYTMLAWHELFVGSREAERRLQSILVKKISHVVASVQRDGGNVRASGDSVKVAGLSAHSKIKYSAGQPNSQKPVTTISTLDSDSLYPDSCKASFNSDKRLPRSTANNASNQTNIEPEPHLLLMEPSTFVQHVKQDVFQENAMETAYSSSDSDETVNQNEPKGKEEVPACIVDDSVYVIHFFLSGDDGLADPVTTETVILKDSSHSDDAKPSRTIPLVKATPTRTSNQLTIERCDSQTAPRNSYYQLTPTESDVEVILKNIDSKAADKTPYDHAPPKISLTEWKIRAIGTGTKQAACQSYKSAGMMREMAIVRENSVVNASGRSTQLQVSSTPLESDIDKSSSGETAPDVREGEITTVENFSAEDIEKMPFLFDFTSVQEVPRGVMTESCKLASAEATLDEIMKAGGGGVGASNVPPRHPTATVAQIIHPAVESYRRKLRSVCKSQSRTVTEPSKSNAQPVVESPVPVAMTLTLDSPVKSSLFPDKAQGELNHDFCNLSLETGNEMVEHDKNGVPSKEKRIEETLARPESVAKSAKRVEKMMAGMMTPENAAVKAVREMPADMTPESVAKQVKSVEELTADLMGLENSTGLGTEEVDSLKENVMAPSILLKEPGDDFRRKDGQPRLFKCIVCGNRCSTQERLESHLRSHSKADMRKHSIDVSDSSSSSSSPEPLLNAHFPSYLDRSKIFNFEKVPTQIYTCAISNGSFPTKGHLTDHRKTHTAAEKKKSLTCKICGIYFRRQVKPKTDRFKCEECGLCLASKCSLNRHIENKHAPGFKHTGKGSGSFSCQEPAQLNVVNEDIQQAERIEQSFSCSKCSKVFSSVANLRAHKTVHTSERPFTCPVCDKDFRKKLHLDGHILKHTGEKPYTYGICKHKFAHKKKLKKHKAAHSKMHTLQCVPCGLYFRNQGSQHVSIHNSSSKPANLTTNQSQDFDQSDNQSESDSASHSEYMPGRQSEPDRNFCSESDSETGSQFGSPSEDGDDGL